MTALAAPIAGRLRRPSWKDTRLVVGLLLVLLATALGAAGLRAADHRVPVLAAKSILVPGQRLDPSQLTTVEVQVERTGEAYLPATADLPADGYVLREVRPGELIPTSAVGTASQVEVAPLAIGIDQVSAATLTIGSLVDVYADKPVTASGTTPQFGGPARVLERIFVGEVATPGSGLGSTSRAYAQLLVPADRVSEIIGLVNAGAKITLVPVPGSAKAGS